MNDVLPWDDLLQPILRKYPQPGQGRRPIPAATMLRIYFTQQWYNLSDPGMEDSLYDVESMRRFAGVGLDAIPAETTVCKFRHLPMMDDCLHGAEQVIYGDKAYVDAQRQEAAQAEGVAWRVLRKAKRGLPWPMYTERVEN